VIATPDVESWQAAHRPLGNDEGGIICVSVRMRRSMWRMRLGFGPAEPLVL